MKFTLFALCCIIHSIYGRNHMSFRVIGGRNAQIGIAPYMCGLKISTSNNMVSRCGCSILSTRWVLTAAHCIDGQSVRNAEVLVGTNHLEDSNDLNHEKTRRYYKAAQWIMHQHWEDKRIVNDIALIQINGEIAFNEGVRPIGFSCTPVPAGANVRITGWGLTQSNGRSSNLLQILNLNTLSFEECKKRIHILNDEHLCAYAKDGATCQGDSGGPLVWNNEVVGVVSYGKEGCPRGHPSVFARVSSYCGWIKKHIQHV